MRLRRSLCVVPFATAAIVLAGGGATAQADGAGVTTLEGLAGPDGTMHPVQRAFHQEHGLQCGFCTPGMVMAIVSMLKENPHPTEQEVREGLEGNFCRCTGYHNIVKSVLDAAGRMKVAQAAE